MPLIRRIPKRGFNNTAFKITYAPVNLADLEMHFEAGSIDEKGLRDKGLVKGTWDGVKILGDGDVTKKFALKVNAISASAKEKLEKAGGSIELVAAKVYPARNSAKVLAKTSKPAKAGRASTPGKKTLPPRSLLPWPWRPGASGSRMSRVRHSPGGQLARYREMRTIGRGRCD